MHTVSYPILTIQDLATIKSALNTSCKLLGQELDNEIRKLEKSGESSSIEHSMALDKYETALNALTLISEYQFNLR